MGGDGVGPEVIGQGLRVLRAVADSEGFGLELVELPHSTGHYRATGQLLDDDTVALLQTCESLLFGAVGDAAGDPDGVVQRALVLGLSQRFGLSIGIRPAFLHVADLTPLKGVGRGGIDLVIVRDTTEGSLAIPGGAVQGGTPYEVSASMVIHTRRGVEATIRHAFLVAEGRSRGRVTLVAQSNVLAPHQLWARLGSEVAAEYPHVQYEALLPDHALMELICNPGRFDVIVTSLLLGGLMTDLVAGLVGGVGLIGSSRVNFETGFGMFEPAHGSAPKYVGADRVSPLATIRAVAMLLDNIDEPVASARIDRAIDHVLVSGAVPGVTTRSGISTRAATDAVLAAL